TVDAESHSKIASAICQLFTRQILPRVFFAPQRQNHTQPHSVPRRFAYAFILHTRLSFAFDFVASDFSPAWRNWQTRWTQNPVTAGWCGFEPLRRHLHWALNVGRSRLEAMISFVCRHKISRDASTSPRVTFGGPQFDCNRSIAGNCQSHPGKTASRPIRRDHRLYFRGGSSAPLPVS